MRMQLKKNLTPLLAIAILAIGTAVQAADADATGTYGWTRPGRNGGPDQKLTLKLKVDGEKLTGTLTSPSRDGGTTDTAIADGKVRPSKRASSGRPSSDANGAKEDTSTRPRHRPSVVSGASVISAAPGARAKRVKAPRSAVTRRCRD